MSNLLKRFLTGTVFVLVLSGCIIWGGFALTGLFYIVMLLGMLEFYRLSEFQETKPRKIPGLLIASSVYITNVLNATGYADYRILAVNIPLVFLIFIAELYRRAPNPFSNIAFTLLGVIYVAIPLSLLIRTGYDDTGYSYEIIMGIFLIIWSNDTFAYLVGRRLGKNKLFERISPKKTWEGSLGGALASYITAYIISLFFHRIRFSDWMIITFILIFTGTLGDLVKSMYKRSRNVKDSGRILPGHGGILDRFDSILLSTPFVYSYFSLIR